MSLGLKAVLGVDTGNISAKEGEQKTLGTEVMSNTDETLKAQNYIERTVNYMILQSMIPMIPWDAGEDYAENNHVSHGVNVYKSIKSGKDKDPSDPTYWTKLTDTEINTLVLTLLSFDADMVRKEIIAWGLGRMAADYQLDIDNTESSLDRWTSGLDFGISVTNTLSNFFSGSSTRRSLVKMGDSYVMMAQDSAEGSDNINFLNKFSENKKSDEEEILGYKFYHKLMYNSPVLLCIQSLCQAADQAMEEIADDKLEKEVDSPERQILYTELIPSIKNSANKKDTVQNKIVDKVARYIANYYMISSFVTPSFGGYVHIKDESGKYLIDDNKSDSPIRYDENRKLKKAASETTLFEIHERNKYKDVNPGNTNYRNDNKLLLNKPYHLLLPMKAPDDKKLKDLKDKDIELFLEVVNVKENDTNGAEVEVKIELPESIKASLSSSIVNSGFNFKFTIPEKIYNGLTGGLGLVSDDKLNDNGKAAQQVFVEIAQNFVKAINPILEANPIIGYMEMLTNAAPDIMDSSKLGIEWRRSQLFHKNNTKKGDFERAADCYGAIPTVLEHSLAYIKSGHYFNDDANFIKDI